MNNKIIFLLIPLSLIFDILTDTVFEKGGALALVRAFVYYSLILYSLFYGFRKKNNINGIFIAFFLYVFLQIPFSSQPSDSLRISLKILMSIMMFPVGYYFINNFKKLKVLNKSLVLLMILYILNYVVSQYYGIGTADYTNGKDFVMGSLSDSWNNITYMLLVIPVVLLTERKKKRVFLLAIILVILLIISLKRIAILGVLLGYVIYIFKTGKMFKSVALSVVFIGVFYATLPIFGSVLTERIESRGDKLAGGAGISNIENEGRYLETFAVLGEVASLENPVKILFGLQAFNSVGNYGGGKFGERQLHVDYNLILNTIGIIGMILYFSIFRFIYKKRVKVKKHLIKNKYFLELDSVFIMLFLTQFLTSIGGQMYAVTFRTIIFLYLGSILGVMYSQARLKIEKSEVKTLRK